MYPLTLLYYNLILFYIANSIHSGFVMLVPVDQNFLNLMQFLGKLGNLYVVTPLGVGWHPLLWGILCIRTQGMLRHILGPILVIFEICQLCPYGAIFYSAICE